MLQQGFLYITNIVKKKHPAKEYAIACWYLMEEAVYSPNFKEG